MPAKKGRILGLALLLFLLTACITQQKETANPETNPQDQNPLPQQPGNESPGANEPDNVLPGTIVSGEFNLKVGDSIKNLRGADRYVNKLLELRVKSVIYRYFPMSKIAVLEVLDEGGVVITQKDMRPGRYANEDIVTEDTYNSLLLDKIYINDVIVSEKGNSVLIEVNK